MKNHETSRTASRTCVPADTMPCMTSELSYSFGHFRLWPERHVLVAGELPIKLGARAFDLLVTLIRSPERVIGKNELMESVWPRLVVEENNLNVQIVALRKVLGHAAIATIPGRGYRFVMPVQVEGGPAVTAPAEAIAPLSPPSRRATNLVGDPTTLYGRGADVDAVLALLVDHPVVTVTGAGGVGKTRLGEVVAHRLLPSHPDGVWWVDLAPLSDPSLVAATVARTIGLDPDVTRSATKQVASSMRSQHALLVLDNCEHVLDAVVAFVEGLRASAGTVRMLLTSQEALKTAGEHVYRLDTLSVPAARTAGATPTLHEVWTSGAGALFVARARAVQPRFELSAANLDAVVEICRCLDGIPLAIELAAARLPLLGVEGVRARLKERFNVLTGGTRAVLRRHQTLRAALDWSHTLLSDAERIVFRRLGVFAGGFTLESAQRVCEDDAIDVWDVLEHLGTLVDKSLVLAEGMPVPRYRMLETTRLFGLEQLGGAGETEAMLRRHAVALAALLSALDEHRLHRDLTLAEDDLLAAEGDNVRAAYDWLGTTAGSADDLLTAELGGVAVLALACAGGVSEAFDRTHAFAPRVGPDTPPATAARFWLGLATFGGIVGSAEAYEAARRAIELYRRLGDEAGLFRALTCRIAIGARRGDSAQLGILVDEARRIERSEWDGNIRTNFLWACYRWLQAEGRHEEARLCALERAAVRVRQATPVLEQMTLGDTVADCELAAGRLDVAETLCRTALTAIGDYPWARAHVLETLAFVCTAQGRSDEAIEHGRGALRASRDMGMHFRLLEAMALNAARQGRLDDAAWVVGHVDRLYAQRGEVRWPHVRARRDQLDALLGAGRSREERARLAADGAAGDLEVAFERAFGPVADPDVEPAKAAAADR